MTEECNGWTNRETWAMNLWLTSDMGYDDVIATVIRNNETNRQAEELCEYMRDNFNWLDYGASLWRDLVGVSLGRVNWQEIIDCNKE